MAITRTNLYLRLRALDPNFKGTPQKFAEAIAAAMEIVAPFGLTTFVTGATQPISNQGPWLKDGKEWWIWDDDQSTYVPLDIESSLPSFYYVQAATPPTNEGIYIWFRINGSGNPAGVYFLLSGTWTNIAGVPDIGPTADRPANPYDLQKYYDTDISCFIWFERGSWRTVDGVRGDLKYTSAETQEEALTWNPGWEIFGTGETNNINYRGKALAAAAKDRDGSNALTLASGVTARGAWELYGIEEIVLSNEQLGGYLTHIHGIAKKEGTNDDITFLRYTDYSMVTAAFGSPAFPEGYYVQGDLAAPSPPVAVPSDLDIYSTVQTQHPDNALTQTGVPLAAPTIAMFLLRKT